MSQIAFPRLDDTILARRDSIIDGLAAMLPRECLIADESGRRAYETDALTAYRRMPLAVALPLRNCGTRKMRAMSNTATRAWY